MVGKLENFQILRSMRSSLVASFGKLAQQVSLVVSNVAGKTLLANNYKQVDGFSEDLSMLMPQLYISKVVADSKTYVNKFIKE